MNQQNNHIIPAPQAGMTASAGLSSQTIQTTGETLSMVLAAREKAEVEARFIIAINRPRDWATIRINLLKACERPGFAGTTSNRPGANWGAAWYNKPIGQGIEGFSIRFAEECIRNMRNLDVRTTVLWEDSDKRLVRVDVVDLESNLGFPTDITVDKTVERRQLKRGQVAISSRQNSNGDVVHLVNATDDEVLQKQNSLASKAIRNAVLRLVPGDIQAECRNRIIEIRMGDAAKDPDGGVKRIADKFATLGINPAELKAYLGHSMESCSPVEIGDLREIYRAVRDGKAKWIDILRAATEQEPEEKKDSPKDPMEAIKSQSREKKVDKDPTVFDMLDEEMNAQGLGKDWIEAQFKKADWKNGQLTERQANILLDQLTLEAERKKGGK